MLSDAFVKQDHTCFKARGVTDLFKVSGLGNYLRLRSDFIFYQCA
jgi:hypothetical protein